LKVETKQGLGIHISNDSNTELETPSTYDKGNLTHATYSWLICQVGAQNTLTNLPIRKNKRCL